VKILETKTKFDVKNTFFSKLEKLNVWEKHVSHKCKTLLDT